MVSDCKAGKSQEGTQMGELPGWSLSWPIPLPALGAPGMADGWSGLGLGQEPRHLQGPEDHSKTCGHRPGAAHFLVQQAGRTR